MEREFSTPAPVELVVHNEVGHVEVSAQPTATTTVRLEAETPEAEALVERAEVECRPEGGTHQVVVKVPRWGGIRFLRRNGIRITVVVPEGSDVAVATASADIEVTGPIGSADLATASGEAFADDVAGDVVAKTASGAITLGDVGGDLRVNTSSGDLRCSSVRGRAEFSTASGDVEIGAAGDRVEVKTASGGARLGGLAAGARIVGVSGDVRVLAIEEGDLQVRSVSGNVSVGVAEGVDLHVDAQTVSGQVYSEIPLDDAPQHGGAKSAPKVDISVRSVSGSIEIERALEQVA
jgi:DUF4097 and DUF4098 domain-containing protein YvlB